MENAKNYLKNHWIPILIGVIPTIAVALVSLINYFTYSNIDYQELKLRVDADNGSIQNMVTTNTKLLQDEIQIKQKQQDQGDQLSGIQTDVRTLLFESRNK